MPLLVTVQVGELEEFLRVDDTGETLVINLLTEMAKQEAEMYLNTDFSTTTTTVDGSTVITPQEAPKPVKVWIFNRIAQLYETRGETGQKYATALNPLAPDFSILKPYRVFPFKG